MAILLFGLMFIPNGIAAQHLADPEDPSQNLQTWTQALSQTLPPTNNKVTPNLQPKSAQTVKTGAEVLLRDYLPELEGRRIGLVMNPTSRVNGVHMLDTLMTLNLNITALFAPEHGFRGDAGAGEIIKDGADQQTGLPVYSLYGNSRKPSPGMLENVDLLLFDMQDVGVRFYTYISTLGLILEATNGTGVEVWVLDRPNPHGGHRISGWMMEREHLSFVGLFPIPVLHGLTIGEIAQMMVGEGWTTTNEGWITTEANEITTEANEITGTQRRLSEQEPSQLRVIPMEGWRREMLWPDTGLTWTAPSPNLQTFEQAFLYPGTAFFEGVSLSEGRGTTEPFLLLGDPSVQLADSHIEKLHQLPGITATPAVFTPKTIPGVAINPKHEGKEVHGVRLRVDDYALDPVRTGLAVLSVLWDAAQEPVRMNYLYLLAGTKDVDAVLTGDADPMTIHFGTEAFEKARIPYLLYD